jgi:hypothetical protein
VIRLGLGEFRRELRPIASELAERRGLAVELNAAKVQGAETIPELCLGLEAREAFAFERGAQAIHGPREFF